MKRPLFSCVVAVKGARPYMDEAIESLRSQGMGEDLEIIIQDADIEPDNGQSDAFNKGFAKARGHWLFWLNADDILIPGALKRVLNVISGQRLMVSWIVGNSLQIDAEGRIVKCVRGPHWHDFLFRQSVPHVSGPSAFFRHEAFERIGGFDSSLDVCMDWDLWIRLMQAGCRYQRIDGYLWGIRQWEGSKTQRQIEGCESERHWAEVRRMLAKNAFKTTRAGNALVRAWKSLDGTYLRSAMDTMWLRGRKI